MADVSCRTKRFVVLSLRDGEDPVEFTQTKAECHEEAYHQAEIANGWGEYLVLDKKQTRQVFRKLARCLKNW